MRFKRTLAGRLFGYGEFVIESAGEEQALRSVPYLPESERLYKQVNEFLFARHGPHDPHLHRQRWAARLRYTLGS